MTRTAILSGALVIAATTAMGAEGWPAESSHCTRAKEQARRDALPKPENPDGETRQMRRARERQEDKGTARVKPGTGQRIYQ